MYSRVKYAIRTIWISGRRAVIIASPSPLNGVTGVDAHGTGIVVITASSDGNIRRRRESEDGKEYGEDCEDQR